MFLTTRSLIFVAMVLMTVVSVWTTYVSLVDSILPGPILSIPIGGVLWEISPAALGLSLAIGLMLFGLKLAIMFEQKKLNLLGLTGLMVVAFISISFNMDVLYRTADRDFYLRYSDQQMRSTYQAHATEARTSLLRKREQVLQQIAAQRAELNAEIAGLRQAPAGFGARARQEAYSLSKLETVKEIELQNIGVALANATALDALLLAPPAKSLDTITEQQAKIRVAIKDISSAAGMPLPPVQKLESPLFAVIAKLFDWRSVGLKELFFLAIAVFLDLGDIVGYSLVPDRKRGKSVQSDLPAAVHSLPAKAA